MTSSALHQTITLPSTTHTHNEELLLASQKTNSLPQCHTTLTLRLLNTRVLLSDPTC